MQQLEILPFSAHLVKHGSYAYAHKHSRNVQAPRKTAQGVRLWCGDENNSDS